LWHRHWWQVYEEQLKAFAAKSKSAEVVVDEVVSHLADLNVAETKAEKENPTSGSGDRRAAEKAEAKAASGSREKENWARASKLQGVGTFLQVPIFRTIFLPPIFPA
jgi:hypothetical protein